MNKKSFKRQLITLALISIFTVTAYAAPSAKRAAPGNNPGPDAGDRVRKNARANANYEACTDGCYSTAKSCKDDCPSLSSKNKEEAVECRLTCGKAYESCTDGC